MKRALPLLLSLFLILTFSGCGEDGDEEPISKVSSFKQLLIGRWMLSTIKTDVYDAQGKLISSENDVFGPNEFEREYEQDKVTFYVEGELFSTGTYTLEDKDGRIYLSARTTMGGKEDVELLDVTKDNLILIYSGTDASGAKTIETDVLISVK